MTLCPSCKSQMVLGTGAQSHVKTCTNTTCVQKQFHFRYINSEGKVVFTTLNCRSGSNKFPMEWLGVAHIPPSCKPVPVYPEIYDKLVKVSVPASLGDSDHFAHLPWLYCQFMAALQEDEKESGGTGTHLKMLLGSLGVATPVAETAPSSGFDFGSKSEGAKDTAAGASFGSGTAPSGGFSFVSSGVATQQSNTPASSNQAFASTASGFSFGGASASAPSAGFGFGASAPSVGFSGFGGRAPAPAPSAGFGGFGGDPALAPSAGFGGFGGGAPAPTPSGGFGFGGDPASAPSGGFGGFGGAPAHAPSGGFGGFGGAPAPAPSGGF